jgi:hypothetical protein
MDIDLSFSYDDFFGMPTIEVLVDDRQLYIGEVQSKLSLNTGLLDDGDHTLSIRHYGKDIHHTTETHDRHVHIDRVMFDHTDLDQLVWARLTHKGKFYPEYEPSYSQGKTLPEYISPNHYLGHNGVWRLEFKVPALLWIIQEQNPSGMHLEDTIFSTTNDSIDLVKRFFKL